MSKVITFSRVFPRYHPKAGQPTYFVEKFWASIKVPIPCSKDQDKLTQEMNNLLFGDFQPKHHTIREGSRWKVGDKFSPRVWSGRPYNSKQLVLSEDVEIKKVWNFEMIPKLHFDECIYKINGSPLKYEATLALNEGLTHYDFAAWFAGPGMMSSKRKPFKGQIICWNENINY